MRPISLNSFRLLTIRCQFALIAEALVQMILMMYTSVSIVMARVKLQKLKDWVLASCSSSKELAPIATGRERNCIQPAMYAEVISR